ncbi:MAG: PIG-L family deacetylase [Alphaproteobacteria bacterium]|nr:PIG-L family deacetylase [Alphaproteobacteria bacterium]
MADARPCALLLSPHPDDECLIGSLPLRLMREQGWRIANLAVTLGSDISRRPTRKAELAKACAVLGFEGVLAEAEGFSGITAETRTTSPDIWRKMSERVASFIAQLKPQAIFLPHLSDAHPAHIGTHHLGMDALTLQNKDFTCTVFQTEYWQPNAAPNLMIGINEQDASSLLAALACHAGENARNPFDVRFPAYLIDNVRRGSELIGGTGTAAAQIDFAMIYQMGLWRSGKYTPSSLGRMIGPADSLAALM